MPVHLLNPNKQSNTQARLSLPNQRQFLSDEKRPRPRALDTKMEAPGIMLLTSMRPRRYGAIQSYIGRVGFIMASLLDVIVMMHKYDNVYRLHTREHIDASDEIANHCEQVTYCLTAATATTTTNKIRTTTCLKLKHKHVVDGPARGLPGAA